MCGIAGYFSFNNSFGNEDLTLMTDTIKHRGPDSSGYFFENNVGLGHRRLSILDLSDRANQPMISSCGRYVIVYNGEVYNYREIASSILYTSPDKNFKTSSDTEAILEAFSKYGTQALTMFNGMFAFAIYDKVNEELYIVRDRLGIKPLFYFWDGTNFVFASELKAIKSLNKIDKKLDKLSVAKYFHFGFIPAPATIYKNIYKVEPGTCIKISKSGFDSFKYWSLASSLSEDIASNEKQATVVLSDLIFSSVQFQLRSDVPFGVFLSGGIDSSLITASAVQQSGTKINTFSIGFEENKFDESRYAAEVAKYLGTNHHQFIVSFKDAFDLFEKMADVYDEPFADSSAIPTMLVSKLAKQHVTVTLSGEGGDELFMGYGSYKWARRLDSFYLKFFKPLLVPVLGKMDSRFKRVSNLLDFKDHPYSHIFSQEQYHFTENEIQKLIIDKEFSGNFKTDFLNKINNQFEDILHSNKRKLSSEEKQSLFEIAYYLPDDLLTKVDRASMQFSLETRVPFLDHRIVEYALNLDKGLKLKGNTSKYLLKEILYQYIPKKYFDRPKQGFAIPLSKWIREDLSFFIDQYLNEKTIEQQGLFDSKYVNKLICDFKLGQDYLYIRIWQLINFQIWYQKNN